MDSDLFQPAVKYEFVNRDEERSLYTAVLTLKDEKRIFCLQAKDGWGKSWLLARLYMDTPQECQKVLIDLSSEAQTEIALILNIAQRIGGPFLAEVKEKVDVLISNIELHAGGDITIQGDVVGGNKYVALEQDPRESENRLALLNVIFKSAMMDLQRSQPVILFLDRFESTTQPVRTWLVEQLCKDILKATYKKVVVVIASSAPLQCFKDRGWHYTVIEQYLKGLPEGAIREYWQKIRKLSQTDLEENLELLHSEGDSPLALSLLADLFEPNT